MTTPLDRRMRGGFVEIITRLFAVSIIFLSFAICSANAETSYLPEPESRDMEPMSFAECTDLIQSYQSTFGAPRVILDAPSLRVVQFDIDKQTEQVACDGDDNLITVLDFGND
jgi:hypothetical protein